MTESTPPIVKQKILPPFYFLTAMLVMLALWAWAPPLAKFPTWLRYLGLPFILIGCALILWTDHLFKRAGTTIKPFEESSMLIVSGPYRLSRNPIYLGMVLALFGFGLVLGALTPVLVIIPFVFLIDRLFIRAEEAALEAKFADTYRSFTARVRRWL
jgi:protein-S-isoprenylcysteine O-methyltransferase Ste14